VVVNKLHARPWRRFGRYRSEPAVDAIAPEPATATASLGGEPARPVRPPAEQSTLSRHGTVLQAIVQGKPLPEVMALIAVLLQSEIPRGRLAIVVIDAEAAGVTVAAAPTLPSMVWPAIERQAIRAAMSGVGVRPELERKVVVTANIADDPSWDEWRPAAADLHLTSSWSMAFTGASNAVLGAFMLYFPAPVDPSPSDLLALGDAAQLAAAATQHLARRQQLRDLSRTDSLTGLPNRVVLLERLRTAQQRLTGPDDYFAVIQLAIDGLAQLNETLGPAAGDEVLRLAARRLVQVAGTSATVAHVWGVEFAVLVEDLTSPGEASEAAAALTDACHEPFDVEGLAVSVGATVGVVVYSHDTAPDVMLTDEPLRAAVAAKDDARERGDGLIEVREPDLGSDPVVLGPELRRGIDSDELSMVYQPIVELADLRVERYEALLRWRSPRRGAVPPSTFVPVAEQTGLVSDLGRYALREALGELARVRAVDPNVGISVNVSVNQLADAQLPVLLSQLLDEHDLPRGSVTLEVTEGVLLRSGAAGWRVLAGLRDVGARIALDDFGTGFSQLSYLRQFWFDEIKIDRSYVTAMMRDVAARAMIVGVIAVAGYAGSEVVGEGVERPEQRAMLLELGVGLGQGYLFGPPGAITVG
jgi:diguanylate cyclase (GGDEF)-like protein